MSEGEYELRCLSPQDLYVLGHALESVYAETGADGDLRWPGRDSRPEELWFLIAMIYGHEGGQRMRPPLTAAVTERVSEPPDVDEVTCGASALSSTTTPSDGSLTSSPLPELLSASCYPDARREIRRRFDAAEAERDALRAAVLFEQSVVRARNAEKEKLLATLTAYYDVLSFIESHTGYSSDARDRARRVLEGKEPS